MLVKKKVVSSSPKYPRAPWFKTDALSNCLEMKCKKEENQLNKNKYVIEKKKLGSKLFKKWDKIKERFHNDKERMFIEYEKADLKRAKDRAKLKLKIIKEKDHQNFINCQLKNCNNDSLNTLKIIIESMLTNLNRNTEKYKLASKYNKLFKANKLTVEDFKRFDIDIMKINLKEEIQKYKINMMKFKKKKKKIIKKKK